MLYLLYINTLVRSSLVKHVLRSLDVDTVNDTVWIDSSLNVS